VLCLITSLIVRSGSGSNGGPDIRSLSDEPTSYIDIQIETEATDDTYYI